MLDNFREWLSDNLRYILLGLAVLLVLVIGVCIFRLVGGSSSKKQGGKTVKNTVETEEVTEVNSTPVTSVPELATTDLVRDDSAILELVTRYYTAAASKDALTALRTLPHTSAARAATIADASTLYCMATSTIKTPAKVPKTRRSTS